MRVPEMASRLKLLAGGALVAVAAVFCLRGPVRDAGAETSSKPAGYTEKFKDTESGEDVSFDMIGIPGGSFTMGSPATEPGRGVDEGPQHEVKIRPFWLGKCE